MKKTLPPIPKSVYFPCGRVKVVRKKGLMENDKAYGMFVWHKRIIYLDAELDLHAAWLTLEHELVHAVMLDAGIQLEEPIEERICDTFAQARVAAMLK